ncbi:MAG: CPBP family glutamic-type intramembrane protease, partial [Candidatus Hodarchaeales archaeon]
IIINLIAQIGSIVIFIFLYQNKKVEPEEKNMPSGSHSITLLLLYSILATFTFSVAFLATFLSEFGFSFESPYEAFAPTLELLGEPIFYVLFFSFYILGASISEELVFRRTFIPFLERRGLGTFWVLLISSLLFSLMHSPQDLLFGSIGFTIIHFFSTFAGGMALGFLYMRTRNIIWPIILHGLNNGVAAVAQIGLARWEQLDDITIFSLYAFWLLTAIAVGAAAAVYFIIQTLRSRGSPSPPTWFRILTDKNLRFSRLQPILLISLGFIGVVSGFPIVFNLIDSLLGPEMTIVLYLLEAGFILLLLGILAIFIFTMASPLKEPDWVSETTFPEKQIPSYPQSYPTPPTGIQKFCGSCGRETVPQTNYCVYCGAQIKTICPSCGREVSSTGFCEHCGMKI